MLSSNSCKTTFVNMSFFAKILFLAVLLTSAGIAYIFNKISEIPPLPEIEEKFWGPGQPVKDDNSKIVPFEIKISKDVRFIFKL